MNQGRDRHGPTSDKAQTMFTTRQAAAFLGITVRKMQEMRYREQGPSYLQYGFGTSVIYTKEALEEFRESHTFHPKPEV